MNATILLYSLSIFLSAFLLFSLEPLVGKLTLPLLGGGPSVWNVCTVFFQASLFGGYCLAHWITCRQGRHIQRGLVAALFSSALLFLPIEISSRIPVPKDDNPSFWLLTVLIESIGLPFLMLSALSPLLQRWFSQTGNERSADPYFLYVASNVGSFGALLCYPFIIERLLPLSAQREWWSVGFVLLFVSVAIAVTSAPPVVTTQNSPAGTAEGPTWSTRLLWIALSAAPSSMMLGTTTYLTTDAAAFPLLWIAPLALYLITLIFAFAQRAHRSRIEISERLTTLVAFPLLLAMSSRSALPPAFAVPAHLLLLFSAGLWCHGRLSDSRPNVGNLTLFYLCMAFGGLLGGLFNGILAPIILNGPLEYPLAILLVLFLRSALYQSGTSWQSDLRYALSIAVVSLCALFSIKHLADLPTDFDQLLLFSALIVPALLTYRTVQYRRRFFLCTMLLFATGQITSTINDGIIEQQRNFFGVLKVIDRPPYRELLHGTTRHGLQRLDEMQLCRPVSYFHEDGPAGLAFKALRQEVSLKQIAIIGLGTGALSCFAEPGDSITYLEIDPAVDQVARDHFSYLLNSKASKIETIIGDARITLATIPDNSLDLLVLDAFSSDAIPIHLLTKEAAELYRSKLTVTGSLLVHISNRYLDLSSVITGARQVLNLPALHLFDHPKPDASDRDPSHWALFSANDQVAKRLRAHGWKDLDSQSPQVWTDDFSNIVSVIRWGRP